MAVVNTQINPRGRSGVTELVYRSEGSGHVERCDGCIPELIERSIRRIRLVLIPEGVDVGPLGNPVSRRRAKVMRGVAEANIAVRSSTPSAIRLTKPDGVVRVVDRTARDRLEAEVKQV